MLSVLGADLASVRWQDNGIATLTFDPENRESVGAIARLGAHRPNGALTPSAAAEWIHRLARERSCSAVSLDGPQGWRSPDTPPHEPGVGRRSDYEARTQGKCGVRGSCFPGTQLSWFLFCIEVFERLLQKPGVRLADDPTATRLAPLEDGYWLLEAYPTSVWRTSGLAPLPGKASCTAEMTRAALTSLVLRYGLALESSSSLVSHDDVQALVAALPAAALLGGPAVAVPRGVPSRIEVDGSRSEGILWDARPRGDSGAPIVAQSATLAADRQEQDDSNAAHDHENRFLPESRDDSGYAAIVERGRVGCTSAPVWAAS
jgi:hypothetical protein